MRSIRPWLRFSAPTTPSCCRTTVRRPHCTPGDLPTRRVLLADDELARGRDDVATLSQDRDGYLSAEDEDVHSAIERVLGDVGRKIHAGRSRNDQVAAAFRLYVPTPAPRLARRSTGSPWSSLSFAEADAETPMPGYTHLQRAQPLTLGHHLLAWVEMLDRDRARFAAAAEAACQSPLGAGALAGSTLALPRRRTRSGTPLDAVADRDFALDYLYAAAVLFTHLSRIGEEIVLWASAEFGFARLPRGGRDGVVDDAAEAESGRGRARPRQGGNARSGASPACSRRSRACRSPTTATCRRTRRPSSRRGATSASRSAR